MMSRPCHTVVTGTGKRDTVTHTLTYDCRSIFAEKAPHLLSSGYVVLGNCCVPVQERYYKVQTAQRPAGDQRGWHVLPDLSPD